MDSLNQLYKAGDRCVGSLGLRRDCKCQECNSFLLGKCRQVNMAEGLHNLDKRYQTCTYLSWNKNPS